MNSITSEILKARALIKKNIISYKKAIGYEKEHQQVLELLQRTVDCGESNSALMIGYTDDCKKLMENVLEEIQQLQSFTSNALVVKLHGLIHTDDRLALKGITSQMSLDNAVDGKVFGSFAENLSFLLACLKTGQKETAKSIIIILEEFDMFCSHHNQTLLYNLFDLAQSAQTPICVIGLTCRLDVIELFEKRVKSRFSHRQIFLFADQHKVNKQHLDESLNIITSFLKLPENSNCKYNDNWNNNISSLLNDKKFQSLIQRFLDVTNNLNSLQSILLSIMLKVNEANQQITIKDFEDQIKMYERDDLVLVIQDLSVLEICLLIAMKDHCEIFDFQPFNFEMILTRYKKFVDAHSNVQSVQRTTTLKAFEHLQNIELISTVSNKLPKEYQLFKLLISPIQIKDGVKKSSGLPTEIIQWANNSLN